MLVCREEEFNGVFPAGRDRCSGPQWYVIKTIPVFYTVISTQKPHFTFGLLSGKHCTEILYYNEQVSGLPWQMPPADKTKILINKLNKFGQ